MNSFTLIKSLWDFDSYLESGSWLDAMKLNFRKTGNIFLWKLDYLFCGNTSFELSDNFSLIFFLLFLPPLSKDRLPQPHTQCKEYLTSNFISSGFVCTSDQYLGPWPFYVFSCELLPLFSSSCMCVGMCVCAQWGLELKTLFYTMHPLYQEPNSYLALNPQGSLTSKEYIMFQSGSIQL